MAKKASKPAKKPKKKQPKKKVFYLGLEGNLSLKEIERAVLAVKAKREREAQADG